MGKECFLGPMCWHGPLSKGCTPAFPAPCVAWSCLPLCRTKVRAAQGRVLCRWAGAFRRLLSCSGSRPCGGAAVSVPPGDQCVCDLGIPSDLETCPDLP